MSPSFPAELAIFDIDGTLVDSRDLHVESWRRALSEAGFTCPKEQIQGQMGRRKPEIVRALTNMPSADDSFVMPIVRRKEEIYQQGEPRLKGLPGSKEIIEALRGAGVRIVLATSATKAEAIQHIARLGIGDYVDFFVSAEDVTRSKPDPEILEVALAQAQASRESSVMIGDSPHDIAASAAAGVRGIGVLTGGYSREDLVKAGAWLVFEGLLDMKTHLVEDSPGTTTS